MKILFLDQFSELGGAQHALLDTVEAVQRMGWEVHAMLPGRGPLVEALKSRQIQTTGIACGPYRSGRKSPVDFARFALDVRKQVRSIDNTIARENIDLIYVNGPRLLPAVALASRGPSGVVFHAHSHLHGFAHGLTRWALRRTEATTVGCSQSVLTALGCDGRVIPNGVRDIGYRERNIGGDLTIGMVGRVGPAKGQMELVNAARQLTEALPQARFLICGAPLFDNSSGYFDQVRLQAHGLPIHFLGWQPDVTRVLDGLDLLIVPSHQEGMARIVLEAFSAGLPVVAFPAGGIPEAIINGGTGFLTRQFTAESLAARILEVLRTDPDELLKIARNARQSWARSYTVRRYQDGITRLLEECLPVSPAARAVEMPLQHK